MTTPAAMVMLIDLKRRAIVRQLISYHLLTCAESDGQIFYRAFPDLMVTD